MSASVFQLHTKFNNRIQQFIKANTLIYNLYIQTNYNKLVSLLFWYASNDAYIISITGNKFYNIVKSFYRPLQEIIHRESADLLCWENCNGLQV